VQYRDLEGNTKIISTKNIIIAWGSQPQLLPGINLTERILTSDGLLNLEKLPASIIIVGASVIGVEFATFFAELGVKVTLIELLDRILPYEDQEAADLLRLELTRLGIIIHTSTKLESLHDNGSKAEIQAQQNNNQLELAADYALLCTGRQPLLYEEELKKLEIQYSKAGIKVDVNMMTNIAGIYAVKLPPDISVKHRRLFIVKILFHLLFTAIRKSPVSALSKKALKYKLSNPITAQISWRVRN
jgi:dihydrolipoamide dehydrogenase